jgi:hypothetical protein
MYAYMVLHTHFIATVTAYTYFELAWLFVLLLLCDGLWLGIRMFPSPACHTLLPATLPETIATVAMMSTPMQMRHGWQNRLQFNCRHRDEGSMGEYP